MRSLLTHQQGLGAVGCGDNDCLRFYVVCRELLGGIAKIKPFHLVSISLTRYQPIGMFFF